MQLIDQLEERTDRVRIEETPDEIRAEYIDKISGWGLYLDGALAPITKSALDTLLNLLRIPIKYIERCVDEGAFHLAATSINFWLQKAGKLSFLTESIEGVSEVPVITQVFSGKRIYLPAVRVNDLIVERLGDCDIHSYSVHDDVYNAVYLLNNEVVVSGEPYQIGVRVLYSDCFSITPRFDGVLYSKNYGALFTWPTLGRKFRVASNTVPQIVDQIGEFVELSLEGLKENVLVALELAEEQEKLIDARAFITRLTNDLRMNKKQREELIENCTLTPNHFPRELVIKLAAYTAKGGENFDLADARDIQLAVTNWIVKGSFK